MGRSGVQVLGREGFAKEARWSSGRCRLWSFFACLETLRTVMQSVIEVRAEIGSTGGAAVRVSTDEFRPAWLSLMVIEAKGNSVGGAALWSLG